MREGVATYSWELDNFIKGRNGVVTRNEFFKLVNRVDNPQIADVRPEANTHNYLGNFVIYTEDNYILKVSVVED